MSAASAESPNDAGAAIVGMGCLFPGAPDLATYWRNIVGKVDAVGEPPDDWDADLYFDPEVTENDRIYCKRGGYLGELARFDPTEFGVMPNSVDGGEPDQFLALRVAHAAMADAGYMDRPFDGERAEVVIGRGTYINRAFTSVVQHGIAVEQTLRILRELHPEHTDGELAAVKKELKACLPPFNADMAASLVPNVMSGRIANRLDLRGPNFTIDAACASSLIAVERAMQDLESGRCDLALVGGVHCSTPAPILMIFCQLGALSRTGQIRPFDARADGTLLGEGAGFVVLKRRADAERDGDRAYAVVRAVGTASDGRGMGLLSPRVEGEELALRRAYELSGIEPATIGLLEAHGTATAVGDATELQALARVFDPPEGRGASCALGCVKSMISHLIPAAGIAALIKVALALHHKVLPPTLHADSPNPELEVKQSAFYLNTETRPWIHGRAGARRAGVNAFGFGGINAHAIVEEYNQPKTGEDATDILDWDSEVCVLEAASVGGAVGRARGASVADRERTPDALREIAVALSRQLTPKRGRRRLALVASSRDDLDRRLVAAGERLADPACARIIDPSGTYYFAEPLTKQGEVAVLFPGEGSQYPNMLADLCLHFPQVRRWFDVIDRVFAGQAIGAPERLHLPAAGARPRGRRSGCGKWTAPPRHCSPRARGCSS